MLELGVNKPSCILPQSLLSSEMAPSLALLSTALLATSVMLVRALPARTAAAFVHEDDGMYGSVIFRQQNEHSPVKISFLFRNIKVVPNQRVDWSIHEEPVHYEGHPQHRRCGTYALGSVLTVNGTSIGQLGLRHGRISAPRFAKVVYDWKLSLYEDSAHSILNRSLAIRQGSGEAEFRCATIQLTGRHDWEPGHVPCERVRYADCLVGTAREEVCVFRVCEGYRVCWGRLGEKTLFCEQEMERFPKAVETIGKKEGVVKCRHGYHTLLRPVIG